MVAIMTGRIEKLLNQEYGDALLKEVHVARHLFITYLAARLLNQLVEYSLPHYSNTSKNIAQWGGVLAAFVYIPNTPWTLALFALATGIEQLARRYLQSSSSNSKKRRDPSKEDLAAEIARIAKKSPKARVIQRSQFVHGLNLRQEYIKQLKQMFPKDDRDPLKPWPGSVELAADVIFVMESRRDERKSYNLELTRNLLILAGTYGRISCETIVKATKRKLSNSCSDQQELETVVSGIVMTAQRIGSSQ